MEFLTELLNVITKKRESIIEFKDNSYLYSDRLQQYEKLNLEPTTIKVSTVDAFTTACKSIVEANEHGKFIISLDKNGAFMAKNDRIKPIVVSYSRGHSYQYELAYAFNNKAVDNKNTLKYLYKAKEIIENFDEVYAAFTTFTKLKSDDTSSTYDIGHSNVITGESKTKNDIKYGVNSFNLKFNPIMMDDKFETNIKVIVEKDSTAVTFLMPEIHLINESLIKNDFIKISKTEFPPNQVLILESYN